MNHSPRGSIQVDGVAKESVLVTGSHNVIIRAEQVMLQAAEAAAEANLSPAQMLRVLAVLAAPVHNPGSPAEPPVPLDLRQEWRVLSDEVRESGSPILLARLTPPTLDALRYALSPRAYEQGAFPHVLHFSGHAWREGLLFEDELGQVDAAPAARILNALKGIPQPLDLVVLNGCESAADAHSVAQALLDGGLARAVVGHERSVFDPEAVAFAARLYAELTNGFKLKDAVNNAQKHITTHQVVPLGELDLHFEHLIGGEPVVDFRRPRGNLPENSGPFLGRGPELVEIASALSHPPALVVVSGPPGIGKSSLLIEAANRNSWRFSGGVAYAEGPRPDTGQSTTAAEMLTALAGALGLQRADELFLHTAAKPTLLLLDNLESLPAVELVSLRGSLRRLGVESAALLAQRPSSEALEELPTSKPLYLHHGLAVWAATRYAIGKAENQKIPLTQKQAESIARAVDGHPKMMELLLVRAGRKDLDEFLKDVVRHRGDFAEQLKKVYTWSAALLNDEGRAAWKSLPLFPGGSAPEAVLKEAAGPAGPEKLREAALADFDPSRQVWRWHATVAEYARGRWPLSKEELQSRQMAILSVWTGWLERRPRGDKITLLQLEEVRLNLEAELKLCFEASYEDAWAFLDLLDAHLPRPEHTLSLRELVAKVWETKLQMLPPGEDVSQARLLNNLSIALSALGRRRDALVAAEEAVDIRRRLAEANPQAFLPDLAASLGTLGSVLRALERHRDAASAFAEGLQHIAPFYKLHPQAFAGLAGALRQGYLLACRDAEAEPDPALLAEFGGLPEKG